VAKCESRVVVKPFTKKTGGSHSVRGFRRDTSSGAEAKKRRGETGALSWGFQRPRVKVDFHGFHTGNEDDHPNAEPGDYPKAIAIG